MKTNDFRVANRCLQVLAQVTNKDWVLCQYVTAAAMFPPEKKARCQAKRAGSIASRALRGLVESGCVLKRKIGSSRINEYQLSEKGWQLARDRGLANESTQ